MNRPIREPLSPTWPALFAPAAVRASRRLRRSHNSAALVHASFLCLTDRPVASQASLQGTHGRLRRAPTSFAIKLVSFTPAQLVSAAILKRRSCRSSASATVGVKNKASRFADDQFGVFVYSCSLHLASFLASGAKNKCAKLSVVVQKELSRPKTLPVEHHQLTRRPDETTSAAPPASYRDTGRCLEGAGIAVLAFMKACSTISLWNAEVTG